MSKSQYSILEIDKQNVENIALDLFGVNGTARVFPGELDFNFKIVTNSDNFILKISRPNVDKKFIEYQAELLDHIAKSDIKIDAPRIVKNIEGSTISRITDAQGNERLVRLYMWIDGRLWSSVNPHNSNLLYTLGKEAGLITKILQDFDHPVAHRKFDWDISQAQWTLDYVNLFDADIREIIEFFQRRFIEIQAKLKSLRHGIVHNDANDNNIIVTGDLVDPTVKAIIDYGDAVYTSVINDLAVTIAYAVMGKPDPLQAALPIVSGYNEEYRLQENELELLYILVAMRLVLSVTKSAINKIDEPNNHYLLISEKPALELLRKWFSVNEELAKYNFRNECDYAPHQNEVRFKRWANENIFDLRNLFPDLGFIDVINVDMSVSSNWPGHKNDYIDDHLTTLKLRHLQDKYPNSLIAGGYFETRPVYWIDSLKKEGNNGSEYRTVHLGVDFWVGAGTGVHSLFPGKIFSLCDNVSDKNCGPSLILEHSYNDRSKFYSIYGHLSHNSLNIHKQGNEVKKGDLIANVGDSDENGKCSPHLHFQIALDVPGNKSEFPSVAYPNECSVWESICPDPNLLFKEEALIKKARKNQEDLISFRKEHLGKSLSLSYNKPLKIVRGDGVFLIDGTGRKYLDTVNNVAHVGHEHHRIVKAGQGQMAILNTNTRYLHDHINEFAEELLKTFPKELSVVHFVNSGSEANELALRMAKTYTGQKDMIAVEAGYHGNTNACIEVSSYKFEGKGGGETPEYTHIAPLPDSYRGIYQGNKTGERYAAYVKEQINKIQQKGRNVAAFICESIISCGGQIELPENYLRIVYDTVRTIGGLCIADEVQVGCGRVGSAFWAFQLHDVIPDIVTVGKPIGNGHPLAAVVCTKEVADAFANGMEYFNTFGGNPVSCAIGLEVLRVIKEENLQDNALIVGNYLKEQLLKLQIDFPIIGDVRGQGLFLGFELNGKNKIPLGEKANYLADRMKDFGILMSTDGPDNNVLKIKPPMVFSIDNADELITRLRTVFKEDFIRLDSIN